MPDPVKKTQLIDVNLTEISLVDRPANQGSSVVLFKRDNGDDPMPGETQELQVLSAAIQKAEESLAALNDANEELAETNTQLTAEVGRLTAELAKRDEQIVSLKKAAGQEGESEEEAITKALGELPPALANLVKGMQTRLVVAEGVIAKAARDRDSVVFIAKADGLVGDLPTTSEKLGGLLMRVEKGETTHDDAEELERLLKAAVELTAGNGGNTDNPKRRDVEIGKRGGENGSTAEQRIEAAAVQLQKADKSLTKEAAVAKALEEDPALYEAYVAERNGQ